MCVVVSAPIPGGKGKYRAKTNGTIWSKSRGTWRRLRTVPAKNGYLVVNVKLYGVMKTRYAHELVLITFRGPRPKGMQARHYPDHTKSNIALCNLGWAKRKINESDKIEHGTSQHGERNAQAKMTWNKVNKMRQMYKTGLYSKYRLAKIFNLSQSSTADILNRTTWVK